MSGVLPVLIYTRNAEVKRKAAAHLLGVAKTRHIESAIQLQDVLDRQSNVVVLFDLQGDRCLEMLPRIGDEWPNAVVIALGEPRSDPGQTALAADVFSIEEIDSGQHLGNSVKNALEYLNVRQQNQWLKEEKTRLANISSAEADKNKNDRTGMPKRIYSRPLHKFKDLDALVERTVEELADTARVSRAGIFIEDALTGIYRFRAGLHCIPGSQDCCFTPESPFVRWLKVNNHIVARQTIEHISNHADRMMLTAVLGQLGAEALIPLHTQDRSLGLLFVGPGSLGLPFTLKELEDLGCVADQISTTLENAMLYEEVALQQSMGATLLDAIPYAFIAIGTNGLIRLVNNSARNILELDDRILAGLPVEELGPKIADALHRALEREEMLRPEKLPRPRSQRSLSIETRSLTGAGGCLGALAIIKDTTEPFILQEKEDQVERASFWTKLASAMSHEIHNPLVTIKTYAQLMPDRYNDEEFRKDFSNQLLKEVDHLGSIVDQINQFAKPPSISFRPLDIKSAILAGIEKANAEYPKVLVKLEMSPKAAPKIKGDEKMLTECFAHIVQNAIEARRDNWETRIKVRLALAGKKDRMIEIRIEDDGKGIDAQILDDIYSPFCTTKARGMGLGAPLAKRIIEDHRGNIEIESEGEHTVVCIHLPVDAGIKTLDSSKTPVPEKEICAK